MSEILLKSDGVQRATGGMALALHSHACGRGNAREHRGRMRVPNHKHATHRRVTAAAAACALGLLLIGGCSSNGAHSRMSRAEIEERVEDEFPLGTPRDAVLTRLRREGATYDSPLPMESPAGWSSLRLYFDQPWWGALAWAGTYRKTEAWADMLFDQGQVLREIRGEVQERRW